MWETLHSAAFLMDGHKMNPEPMFNVLRVLLPCVHCRNSFQEFYREQGPPRKGHAAQWIYDIHKNVNRKLLGQRLEKVALASGVAVGTLMPHADLLLAEPTMLVLKEIHG